jgi:DnaJ-class molecular chaperone
MTNYYDLLEINTDASNEQIISSYKIKITRYNNMSKLSEDNINEIKELKKAIYVLTNNNLKILYNNKLHKKKLDNNILDNNKLNNLRSFNYDNTQNTESVVASANSYDNEENLDSMFVSIMNDNTEKIDTKKDKVDSSSLGNRIFSLSHLNKAPGLNDFNLKLRKPENGRIEK